MIRFRRLASTVLSASWFAVAICLLPMFHAMHGQAILVLQPGSSASTLVGTGADGHVSAGDARLTALGSPQAIAYDGAGVLYVADARNHQVLRVDTTGRLTVLAGTGRQGFAGDGGPAIGAELSKPSGIAADSAGNVFVADTGNGRVRRIAAADGTISTVAGSGVAGFSGDGGPAVAASLRMPGALAVDNSGALYIADTGNHRVRKLTSSGTLSTVAGNGQEGDSGDGAAALAASFGMISSLAALRNGQLLIADTEAHRVRALNTNGTVVAYSMGALPVRRPAGLAADGGSVYLADAALQTVGSTSPDGASTVVGTGEQGTFHAGGPLQTPLDAPVSVAPGALGVLAIADTHNRQVQQVQAAALDFGSIPTGSQSAGQPVTLLNSGKTALSVSAVQMPANFVTLNSGSTCTMPPFTLQPGSSCGVAIAFAPAVQGPLNALAQVRFNGGAPQVLLLKGTGAANGSLTGSATALRTDGTITYAGSALTLSASVSGPLQTPPVGNITFLDGATPLSVMPLNSGAATFSTASLAAGQHSLRAVYAGDAAYSTSSSPLVTVTVVATPDFALSAGAASYSGKAGASVTVPLTLLPINGTLNRVVQLAVTGLPNGATATFSPSTFTLGGTSTAVSLNIQMPATLSSAAPVNGYVLACVSLLLPLVVFRKGGRTHLLGIFGVFVIACSLQGCGSGFRAGSTQADLTASTKTYNAVVTATTTGVLGSPLAHSTPVGLVISK